MSAPRNPNRRMAAAIAEELRRSGVADVCLSPGSRSAPLALAFAATPGLRIFVVNDERSGGFFALGLARETGRPVALLSTSGTAAANYLPAVVEASLANVPIVVLTADRPPELRDCGAPQTIHQVGLFAGHARWSVDVPAPSEDVDLEAYHRTLACRAVAAALEWPNGPVHLNLPMREPLIDVGEEIALSVECSVGAGGGQPERCITEALAGEPFAAVLLARPASPPELVDRLATRFSTFERGVIICGAGCEAAAAEEIASLAAALGWPILADPLSGLRFGAHDRSLVVDAYDGLLREPRFAAEHAPEAVLQIGALPASKPLTRLVTGARRSCHVVVAPPRSWPDPLHRATDIVRATPGELSRALAVRLAPGRARSAWLEDWVESSRALRTALDEELAVLTEILEGKLFPRLVDRLPAGSLVVLGNSMPVRDADTFLGSSGRAIGFAANRGASGIDGVLSSALGAASARRAPTALVVGDLSFLHDLGALQISAREAISLLVVAVQNDGGGIFSFLPQAELGRADDRFERLFATPHGLELEPAVRMAGGRHVRADSWPEFDAAIDAALDERGLRVIELRSDRVRNRSLHERTLAAALGRFRDLCEHAA